MGLPAFLSQLFCNFKIRAKQLCNKLSPSFDENVEKEYQAQVLKNNLVLQRCIAVGVLLHFSYVCFIVFVEDAALFSYISLFAMHLPLTIFVSLRYTFFQPQLNSGMHIVSDIIVAIYSLLWAATSIALSLICKVNPKLGEALCTVSITRPVSIGLVAYVTFGVLLTLIVLRVNKLIMAINASLFSIYFTVVWIYIMPKPYIILLPCLSFLFFTFVIAHNSETAERQNFQLAKELEQKISANLALQQREQILQQNSTQFINYVFHELRVNLNTITLNWELVSNDFVCQSQTDMPSDFMYDQQLATLSFIDRCEISSSIQAGMDGLANILNDVLDIRKIQEGKFSLTNRPFDISKTIKSIVMAMQASCNSKNIKLVCDIDQKIEDLPNLLLSDENRIRQIVANYLSNAIKFTKSGGNITIQACLTKLVREFESDEDSIVQQAEIYVAVKDDGVGISVDNQAKLFKNFSQIHNENSPVTSGTSGTSGLGLSIIKSIVTSLNGEYGVRSFPGKGSTFWFRILFELSNLTKSAIQKQKKLYAVETQQSNPNTSSNTNAPCKSLQILIVDDDTATRKIMSRIVQRMGHNCVVCSNGLEALNAVKTQPTQHKFDVIITDSNMPQLSGEDFIKELREQKYTIPVILATGSIASSTQQQTFFQMGANAMLVKPIKAAVLEKLIRTVCNFNLAQSTIVVQVTIDLLISMEDCNDFVGRAYLVPIVDFPNSIKHVIELQTQCLSGPKLRSHLEAVAFVFQHYGCIYTFCGKLVEEIPDLFFEHFLKLPYAKMTAIDEILVKLGRPANFASGAFGFSLRNGSIMSDDAIRFYQDASRKNQPNELCKYYLALKHSFETNSSNFYMHFYGGRKYISMKSEEDWLLELTPTPGHSEYESFCQWQKHNRDLQLRMNDAYQHIHEQRFQLQRN